jgi:dipeptidyl aminopeptidase/acylaminoacyl peptidase
MFNRGGDLYQRSALGGTAEDLLLKSPVSKQATSWSRDGRFVLFYTSEPNPNTDIWALPMQGDKKPFAIAATQANERDAQFSPDGKWIAFQSDESGRFEVFVQPFPGPGNRLQISSNGGAMARWRADGKELFYIGLDDRLMSVAIRPSTNSLDAGTPMPLFLTRVGGAQQANSLAQYVVPGDGQRFLMNTIADEDAAPIVVVLNWKHAP